MLPIIIWRKAIDLKIDPIPTSLMYTYSIHSFHRYGYYFHYIILIHFWQMFVIIALLYTFVIHRLSRICLKASRSTARLLRSCWWVTCKSYWKTFVKRTSLLVSARVIWHTTDAQFYYSSSLMMLSYACLKFTCSLNPHWISSIDKVFNVHMKDSDFKTLLQAFWSDIPCTTVAVEWTLSVHGTVKIFFDWLSEATI